MLWASSREDEAELREEGREERKRDFRLLPGSRGDLGVFGAVRAEKPEGGFAVRIVGGLAASSLRSMSSSCNLWRGGWEKPPYSTPKLPFLGELAEGLGTERL